MNLENLNLVELNAQEVNEVDGGYIDRIVRGVGILLTISGAYDAWNDFKDGWNSVP